MIDYLHAKRGGRANENYPYGGTRTASGTQQTDRLYTDQRQEGAALGALYDYGARHYDTYIGRFLTADSVVPGAGNPQNLNRYSYSLNNPVRYNDPTGHACLSAVDAGGCGGAGLGTSGMLRGGGGGPIVTGAALDVALSNSASQIGAAIGTAADLFGGVVQVNPDKLPELINQARRAAENAGDTTRRTLQGGNSAGPGGMDPWRWGQNYAQNYEQYYSLARDSGRYEVHHVLPQRFADILARSGTNVHNPRLLREVIKTDYQTGVAIHERLYTDVWSRWADELGHAPTAREIVEFARQLEAQYAMEGTLFFREMSVLPGAVDWNFVMQLLQGVQ